MWRNWSVREVLKKWDLSVRLLFWGLLKVLFFYFFRLKTFMDHPVWIYENQILINNISGRCIAWLCSLSWKLSLFKYKTTSGSCFFVIIQGVLVDKLNNIGDLFHWRRCHNLRTIWVKLPKMPFCLHKKGPKNICKLVVEKKQQSVHHWSKLVSIWF